MADITINVKDKSFDEVVAKILKITNKEKI